MRCDGAHLQVALLRGIVVIGSLVPFGPRRPGSRWVDAASRVSTGVLFSLFHTSCGKQEMQNGFISEEGCAM